MRPYDFNKSDNVVEAVMNAYHHEKKAGNYEAIKKKYQDPGTQYCFEVLDGKYKTSTMLKLAAFRQLQDLRRITEDDSFNYVYDLDHVRIILNFSKIVPDVDTGKPVPLMLWQKAILSIMFGWRDSLDNKRYDRVIVSVARTNGKTYLSAIILTYSFIIESAGKSNQDMAYIAPVTSQSKKGFSYLKTTMDHFAEIPAFKKLFEQMDTHVQNDQIISKNPQNVILRLSHESGRFDSRHFVMAVLDESGSDGAKGSPAAIAQIARNVGQVSSGMMQTGGSMFQISTAYPDPNSYFYKDERMLERVMRDDTSRDLDNYLCLVWEQDSVKETEQPDTWEKSNPLITLSEKKKEQMIRSLINERNTHMAAGNIQEFQNKNMNIWLKTKANTYLTLADIEKSVVQEPPIDIDGREVTIGFDKSMYADDTSVSFIFPYSDGTEHKWFIVQHSFIPLAFAQGSISLKEKQDGINYREAANLGFADVTKDAYGFIDDGAVFSWITNFVQEHQLEVKAFCFDAWHADEAVTMWIDQKTDWLTIPVRQGSLSLNKPTLAFRQAISSEQIRWLDDPLIRYSFNNAVLVTDNNGVKVDKNNANAKIDIVDATIDAFFRAQYDFDDVNLDKEQKDPFANMTPKQRKEYWNNFSF
ncbi:terminase TerL endonuclease subunit [Limosilactobacillus portuensis]|uniref:terminase TerL endonuclease subunit n=1 Tax=Limosilactobacillus portuensis TaxID=2742601 RepID=UPI0023596F38|nr:terminase TerL endonuclease subunit [Limosilactobacillus portuensis]WCT61278.1 terminase large subunit [Limosilactobacillus portuensis]